MSIFITENEIVTYAHEVFMSIENTNQFYVGITVSMSTSEYIVIET